MTKHTTLARRGADLASLPSMRDQFKSILNDPYDPDTNPTGFINVGVAENVSWLSCKSKDKHMTKTHQYAMIPEVTRYVNSKVRYFSFSNTAGNIIH